LAQSCPKRRRLWPKSAFRTFRCSLGVSPGLFSFYAGVIRRWLICINF
jgi:hypothetical protein